MSNLPSGWCHERLKNLTSKIGSGATPRGGQAAYATTGTPLIRSMNVHFDGLRQDGLAYIDKEQARALDGATVHSNDVLLNITGASIGRATYAPADMHGARVNQHVCIIRLLEGVMPELVSKYIASPRIQAFILSENYGVTRQALTKEMVENIEVPVPPPAEQRRIVAKIASLSAKSKRARDRLDHMPRLVEKYKQGVLSALFHKIEDDVHTCTVEIGALRDGEDQPILTGPFGADLGKADFHLSGVPVITIGCLTEAGISLSKAKFVSKQKVEELERYKLREGDLLFSRMATVGRAGLVEAALEGAIFNYHLMRLRLDWGRITSKYLLYYVRGAPLVSTHLEVINRGATRDGINSKGLSSLPILLPSIEKQKQLVRKAELAFAWIDRLAAEATSAQKLLDHLDQAVLSKAFRGELVPQDPDDEPASVLLERIKAEKAGSVPGRRGRGRPRVATAV